VSAAINIADFEQVYREHFTRLCYYALDLVGNMETAQDVVNDAAYNIWQRRDTVHGDKLEGLLFITVRNGCMNVLRHRKVQLAHTQELMRQASEVDDVDALREREQRLVEVQHVIEQMSPRTRYVLEQCYLNDRSYKDVAAVLEITTDGVKKHITKALATLRAHFNVENPRTRKNSSLDSTQKALSVVFITILIQLMLQS